MNKEFYRGFCVEFVEKIDLLQAESIDGDEFLFKLKRDNDSIVQLRFRVSGIDQATKATVIEDVDSYFLERALEKIKELIDGGIIKDQTFEYQGSFFIEV